MHPVRSTFKAALPLRQGLLEVITFDGANGLRLVSCIVEGEEMIDASAARPVIGPHFGSRIPELFRGERDPVPNGAAHTAFWSLESKRERSIATCSAAPDSPLAELEKQPFSLRVEAGLDAGDLMLIASHMSETDSVIGIPFAFAVPKRRGVVETRVQSASRRDDQGWIRYACNEPIEAHFSPYPSPVMGSIRLETERYTLLVEYRSRCEENSWQLTVPQEGEWVEITLFTATNPRKPILSSNALEVRIGLTG